MSYEGILELMAVPAGLLMIGASSPGRWALVLAVMYLILFFVGPLQRGPFTHRNGGDPVLLNAFFFLYLAAAGGGAWSVDRLRGRDRRTTDGRTRRCGVLRIAAGCLFIMHGLEKIFGVGGGRIDRDIMTMRGFAGWLESVGGPLIILGCSPDRSRSSCRAKWRWPTSGRGRREASGKALRSRAWKRRSCFVISSCSSARQDQERGALGTCCVAAPETARA